MKTIIVLGMHRSATSLIAKGLDHEISMGRKMLGPNGSQPLGHFEDLDAMKLNEQILRAAGGSYLNPPPEKAILALAGPAMSARIKAFVKKASHNEDDLPYEIWGWKDPRTTLTVRLFLPHVKNPHLVCCFRDPMEVARSLQKRGDCGLPKGLQLAIEYNRRLVKLLEEVYCE